VAEHIPPQLAHGAEQIPPQPARGAQRVPRQPARGGETSRLDVYRYLIQAQVRGQAAYRTSFVLDLAGNALIPVIDVLVILALFRVTRSVGGFTAFEVLTMFGLSTTSFALADLAVGNIEKIRVYVRQGLLDAVLLRPLSALGQLVALDFTIRRISRVVVALAVLGLALSRVNVQWNAARIGLVVIAPLFGALFFAAIFVMTATVAFWWIDSGEFANAFTYGGRDFTAYPVSVYGGVFRVLFAYCLGFAFVAYYPALALLGRVDPLGSPAWVAWSSPLVAVVAAGFAAVVWRFGLRHYRSTGS
jgi:ABC-2 type transport system permease protein